MRDGLAGPLAARFCIGQDSAESRVGRQRQCLNDGAEIREGNGAALLSRPSIRIADDGIQSTEVPQGAFRVGNEQIDGALVRLGETHFDHGGDVLVTEGFRQLGVVNNAPDKL